MRYLTLFVLIISLSACATSPTGRHQLIFMPDEQVEQMGAKAFAQMKDEQTVETDTTQSRYVDCVAQAVTAASATNYPWNVALFKSDQVNAFALPGGEIGVYSGLLKVAATEDQLAAVLGHEVGHVLAKHANERMSLGYITQTGTQLLSTTGQGQQLAGLLGIGMQYGVALPFSRTQESEADVIGLELMAKAGFNPRAAITLWKNMSAAGGNSPPEILSTHPSDSHRIRNLSDHMPAAERLYQKAKASGQRPNCVAAD